MVDVLRDPLADPLNRRYRPFGEWAQDQIRQPNLFYNRTGTATGTTTTPDRRGSATGSTGLPGTPIFQGGAATTTGDRRASATGSTGLPGTPIDRTGGQAATAAAQPRTPGQYDWLYDVQPGQQYTEGKGWTTTGPVAAGQWVADGLGLPVNYDPNRDRAQAWGPNGKPETSMRRVFRIAADMLNNGITDDRQNAVNFAMAQVSAEAKRGGYTDQLGWDANAFRPMGMGEKFNANLTYLPGNAATSNLGVPGAAPATPGGTATNPTTPTVPVSAQTTTTPAPAQPGQQTGGPNVADPTAATNPNDPAFKGQYWMTHPQEVADQFVRSHGVNPGAHTAMGDWLMKLVNGIAPDVMSTFFGSNGKPAVDQLSDPNQLLNSIFYNGGGIGQNLQNYAQTAMNTLRGNPTMQSSLGDTGIQDFLSRLNGLNTFGMNPYMSQAYGNAYDDRMNAGLRSQRDQLFKGQPLTSLWDFINQAGQPSFGSYGLPGGGGGVGATGGGGVQTRY